jgi:hypothetical protein
LADAEKSLLADLIEDDELCVISSASGVLAKIQHDIILTVLKQLFLIMLLSNIRKLVD